MKNKFDAKCIRCGKLVLAGTGHVGKTRSSIAVRHHACVALDKIDNGNGIFGKDLPTSEAVYRKQTHHVKEKSLYVNKDLFKGEL